MILTIRTDKPEAEIGLYNGQSQFAYRTWEADRQLSDTLLRTIELLLGSIGKTKADLTGIVIFSGPGSFTGLRIGATVGNAIAYSAKLPIVGSKTDDWIAQGIQKLLDGNDEKIILPEYGRDAHITKPKK